MNRKELQQRLQQAGLNRFEARRRVYGNTWKTSTAPGRGVQLAITKEEKLRREALRGAFNREAEAGRAEGEAGNPEQEWDRKLSDAGQGPRAGSLAAPTQRTIIAAAQDSGESQQDTERK